MKVIGLTGGTGSGKSVVSKSLAAAGAVVIDADKIAHEIILKGEPAYQEIVKYYGTGKRKYHPQKAGGNCLPRCRKAGIFKPMHP